MRAVARRSGRGLCASGLLAAMLALPADAAGLPANEEELVLKIRTAIETSDYDALKEIVLWKGAGKIKKRIVRFHLNRSLGRPIKSIEIVEFPADGLDGLIATGKLEPNIKVTHAVHVVFDEPAIDKSGKLPTSVFLVGKKDDVFRIGLVNRKAFDDDDD
ncbi:hypothetical protein KHP62_08645 [Rhodobacteraceae bacterium NNCM2]|nr:hypothetical protein [Coraliihabitans acroporae]